MIFQNWHLWGDSLTLSLFNHDHQWLHIIVHTVLVVMPAFLAGITMLIMCRFFRRYVVTLSTSETPKVAEPLQHRIPLQFFQFIKRYTLRSQVLLVFGALLTLPITFASLELPKRIINGAINTDNFATSSVSISFNQIDYLMILSGFHLVALILNSVLKFFLNYYKGSVAEFLIKRLRLYLFSKQRKSSSTASKDKLVPVIIQEVEPVCGFSGDSFVVPLLQGGTALTILSFMLMQNLALGAAAITLLPIQVLVIPRFQHRINQLVRQRVLSVRQLSQQLNQSEDNGAQTRHKEIRYLFSHLHGLRMKIFKTKYMMKSLNNFIMNLTPFFFYIIGGYLVIEGKLSLGALVATLTSYKDLASSIRELFTYYQSLQDAKIRYHEIFTFMKTI